MLEDICISVQIYLFLPKQWEILELADQITIFEHYIQISYLVAMNNER